MESPYPYLGEAFALLAAVNWAFSLVLFKLSGESIPPLSLSLFKNVVGLALLFVTLGVEFWIAMAADGASGSVEWLSSLHRHDMYILIFSGVIGIALADTLLFFSLNLIGVGLLTIVECIYTPAVILFAWALLCETVAPPQFIGMALILSGVFISSTHKPPADRTRGQLVLGLLLGALALALTAFGIVLVKPLLVTAPLIPATTIRLVAGTVVLVVIMAVSPKRAAHYAVFKPSSVWKVCVPASVFGTYLAMIFWIGGFKYAQAAVAAVLNQTSTIIALIFATLILKEPFTKRKLVAAVLAVSGVLVVMATKSA